MRMRSSLVSVRRGVGCGIPGGRFLLVGVISGMFDIGGADTGPLVNMLGQVA